MPIIRSSTTAVAASVLRLECGGSSAVGRGRAGRPDHDQQHCYYHALRVKPEAATAGVVLLMLGMSTPETCGAVFKRQLINLRNCCICLFDSFEYIQVARIKVIQIEIFVPRNLFSIPTLELHHYKGKV
jgi:hypothetical protein